jgi:mannan endo-1,4-beta-mannosidase
MKRFLLALVLLFTFYNLTYAQLINLNGKNYFINGVNIPWNVYARDFGINYQSGAQYDSAWFESTFTQYESYGINCARFWLHGDGATSPEFNSSGYVTGLDTNFFSNLDDLFNRALKHHIMLIPSLWDFYMMNNDSASGVFAGNHASLIQDSSKTRSYINNALIPMVQRYTNQCNLLAWEIMNEPEWAMNIPSAGTTAQVVATNEMQRFVGMLAEAIHQHSSKMVTVGSASLLYNSDKFDISTPCVGNYWKDQAIQSAYNKPLAHLDFYEIHYYDWMNSLISFDPFKPNCPFSYWLLDKPALIGETQGNSTKHSQIDMLNNAHTGNYAGVMFWSYAASSDGMGQFSDFNSALSTFRNANTSIVDVDSSSCNTVTTGVNQFTINNSENMYPNPATNTLNITGITNKSIVKLYDVLGNLVLEKETDENLRLNVSLIAQGVYTVVLENNKTKNFKKVVITK